MDTPIRVHMLGDFYIQQGTSSISSSGNRSRKVWLLLAYMVYNRSRAVSLEELTTLLWGEEGKSNNPANALKTMFYRVRSLLGQLNEQAGRNLVMCRDSVYTWNNDIPLTVDVDEFEQLCQGGVLAESEDEKLARWQQAMQLYKGSFLVKLSAESWVVPISAYYHNLYIQTALEVLALMERRQCWQEMAALCKSVLEQDVYLEEVYRYLMIASVQMGNQRAAVKIYEDMSELFLTEFGIMPSAETVAVYRNAVQTVNDKAISMGTVLDQLRETEDNSGALFFDYDVFRATYQTYARTVSRSGDAVHLVLISIVGADGKTLSRQSLDRVVENLKKLISSNLRKCDIAARCSVSQFVILLPMANYENSVMISDRITKAFARQYPHSPAVLHTTVQALEPN